jgi:hypothetical protein
MPMANKTIATKASITDFVNGLEPERVTDCKQLIKLMQQVTGCKPVLWGQHIIGFGTRQYQRANGDQENWFWVGFSPRKNSFSLYICGENTANAALFKQLGTYKMQGSCIHIKKISDVNTTALAELITQTIQPYL